MLRPTKEHGLTHLCIGIVSYIQTVDHLALLSILKFVEFRKSALQSIRLEAFVIAMSTVLHPIIFFEGKS